MTVVKRDLTLNDEYQYEYTDIPTKPKIRHGCYFIGYDWSDITGGDCDE